MRGVGLYRLSLWQRFAIAAAIVLLAGSVVIGRWVVERISEEVTRNVAFSSALLVDGLISPLAQELKDNDVLSIGPVRALDEILATPSLRDRLLSVKIWKPDGQIAYSDNLDLIGSRFEPSESLRRAAGGEVVVELDELEEDESARERQLGVSLLEIYSPVRNQWTGEVIAVAEFYEMADDLALALSQTRRSSWFVVGATTAGMALVLFGIVYQGSRTIGRQRSMLEQEIDRAAAVSRQNMLLRTRVERAYSLSTELNERYLRRVSADLHDGPAQLVGLAALRVGSLADIANTAGRRAEASKIREVLSEAMSEIRAICADLSLPKIETRTIPQVARDAIRAHEKRTGARVESEISDDIAADETHIKICVYRFIQEGLTNAFRHARGSRPKVVCILRDGTLHVSVENGPFALAAARSQVGEGRLGLEGLRGRVEALSGSFGFDADPERGSRLAMAVKLEQVAA